MPDTTPELRPAVDLSTSGLLWLINRTVFHPRGLALAVAFDEAGQTIGWRLLGDGTEPIWFTHEDDVVYHAAATRTLAAALDPAQQQARILDRFEVWHSADMRVPMAWRGWAWQCDLCGASDVGLPDRATAESDAVNHHRADHGPAAH